MEPSPPVLAVQNLSRRFPGVLAVDNVSFDLLPGEVHALVGENGAGKSTVISILAGVQQPSAGRVLFDQKPIFFPDPLSAQRVGLSVIFQEFSLLPHLSVAENVFINREPKRGLSIDWPVMRRQTLAVLQKLNLNLDPTIAVSELSVSQQQLVEIARALSINARVIVMDEPTAALSEREAIRLLEIVRSLATNGVGVLYVSHRLAEVFSIADRITVLRDGKHILTERRSALTEQKVVTAMVGRELVQSVRTERKAGSIVLEAENLTGKDSVFRNVSFTLREGEVLGLAGLMGSGCSELVEALFGLRQLATGRILFSDRHWRVENPRQAMRSGIGLVPDDRKRNGLFPDLSVTQNLTISRLLCLATGLPGILDLAGARQKTLEYQRQLNVRFNRPEQRISGLSGGNQQKVILARALAINCRVLLLAEPTRGVDVGAKSEIYQLIDRLLENRIAIILQTSELPELLRLADRCLVFAAGEPRGELRGREITQETVMALATGLSRRVSVASSASHE